MQTHFNIPTNILITEFFQNDSPLHREYGQQVSFNRVNFIYFCKRQHWLMINGAEIFMNQNIFLFQSSLNGIQYVI